MAINISIYGLVHNGGWAFITWKKNNYFNNKKGVITKKFVNPGTTNFLPSQEVHLRELQRYYTDSASFAGDIVRGIARAKHDGVLWNHEKATLTDNELRFKKMVWEKQKFSDDPDRKVHLMAGETKGRQIIRKMTGFVRHPASKHEKVDEKYDDDDDLCVHRSVRIDPGVVIRAPVIKIIRRPTAYSRPGAIESGLDIHIQHRKQIPLLHFIDVDEVELEPPTLKGYRRRSDGHPSMMLTSTKFDSSSDDPINKCYRDATGKAARSLESLKTSLRSVVFAKKRPLMSVEEYQSINQQYREQVQREKDMATGK